jgi:hypothetical protein
MVLIPQCNIEIGVFQLDYLAEVTINSSFKNLTDLANIKFPKPIKYQEKAIDQVLKSGDSVLIQLGFDVLKTSFEGYIKTIQPKRPVELECEDLMWQYKRKGVEPKSWKDTSVKEVLQYLGFSNPKMFGEMQIGGFAITPLENNIAKVLAKLKEHTKFPIFLRNGILNFGTEYDPSAPVLELEVGRNIVKHDLEFIKKEDTNIQITATNHLKNGKKVVKKYGVSGGDTRTMNFYDVSETFMKQTAEKELSKKRFDGLKGKITVLGNEFNHGDIVKLTDPVDGEIVGSYYIDEVETKSGAKGLFQELTTGPKAA